MLTYIISCISCNCATQLVVGEGAPHLVTSFAFLPLGVECEICDLSCSFLANTS
jgi:hypothetical protein